jgi:hypothetical protein
MEFENAHTRFIQSHLDRRSGERRDRLLRGHLHAEKLFAANIWWPLKGNFDHLHPEYEVMDWRGRSYFADYGYRHGHLIFLIEIKGFASHIRDMDRTRFSNELNRELFLAGLGFRIISFSYDDVANRAELCITLLRTLLNRYHPMEQPSEPALFIEMEVIRLAYILARPFRPIDISHHCNLNHRTAIKILKSLCTKGWIRPIQNEKTVRVVAYQLVQGAWDFIT